MMDQAQDRHQRAKQIWRWIDHLCFAALIVVITTVVYGLALRATFEKSYWIACALAICAAFFVLIALAQQTIAARDEATWREMAEWQLKAATARLEEQRKAQGLPGEDGAIAPDGLYYEQLLTVLIDDMHSPAKAQG